MASIECRTNGDGATSHRVRFRHAGKNQARTFDNHAAAEEFRSAVELLDPERALALLDSPAPVLRDKARTVAEQVESHIDHLTGIEEGTRRKYRKMAAGRIADTPLGRTLLPDLTRDDVARWVNQQTGSSKTIKNVQFGVLSPALESAVRDGLIPANPAKGVRPPKETHEVAEHVYLDAHELAVLLGMLTGRRAHWRPFVLFLVGTGVRFSEASALTIADLDIEHAAARIRQAWKDTSGGPAMLGRPKTKTSRRTVSIPPTILPSLAEVVAGRKPGEFVFTNTRGNPIRNGAFHESPWQPTMDAFEEATGKRPRVHDLRHTYASWAIRSGTNLPTIQRQMGHESIQVTVDTYGHLVRSDFDALAVRIGENLPQIGPAD